MATKTESRLSPAELAVALEAQPLVGVTAAAKRLGIKPPNFRRDAAPHLTEVPVEGSASVYFRNEVDDLAAERQRARSARANGHAAAA